LNDDAEILDDAVVETAGEPGRDDPVSARGRGRDSVIRDAALELLAEVGYDRMSMDAVAGRAHASKATIYRHWPGKQELVLDAFASRAGEAFTPPDTGSLSGDIVATLRAMAAGMGGTDAELMVGVLRAMRNAPELAVCVRDQIIEQKRYIGRTLVERAVRRGELPPAADPEVFHQVTPALMFYRLIVLGEPIDDDYLRHVADDVLIPLLVHSAQAAHGSHQARCPAEGHPGVRPTRQQETKP
jgi:AcrR family transcriptional regulator